MPARSTTFGMPPPPGQAGRWKRPPRAWQLRNGFGLAVGAEEKACAPADKLARACQGPPTGPVCWRLPRALGPRECQAGGGDSSLTRVGGMGLDADADADCRCRGRGRGRGRATVTKPVFRSKSIISSDADRDQQCVYTTLLSLLNLPMDALCRTPPERDEDDIDLDPPHGRASDEDEDEDEDSTSPDDDETPSSDEEEEDVFIDKQKPSGDVDHNDEDDNKGAAEEDTSSESPETSDSDEDNDGDIPNDEPADDDYYSNEHTPQRDRSRDSVHTDATPKPSGSRMPRMNSELEALSGR